jgi:hypothetical protein
MYNIITTFIAENPCNAARNMNAKPKSKDTRCSRWASPSAADIYEPPFSFGELLRLGIGRKASYNRRRIGWKVKRSARYGTLVRKEWY